VNWRIFQFEYHRYSFFCPTVGSGGRSLDLHLGLSVLLIPLPPFWYPHCEQTQQQRFSVDLAGPQCVPKSL
jgi:hypothetical protein